MTSGRTTRRVHHRPRQLKRWLFWTVCLLVLIMVPWLIPQTFSITNSVLLRRDCTVPWPTLTGSSANDCHICLTMLTDANYESKYREVRRIDFSYVLEATWSNKVHYASKHSYKIFNASDLLDVNRPPNWSKILAVQDALKQDCDWVFYMDADSLVMNSEIRIEDILPADKNVNLLIARDPNGYNSGMWMVRKSSWTNQFLKDWWSMTSHILPPGRVRSGDNYALEELLANMSDIDEHVYVSPQCAFNSYPWGSGLKNWSKYLRDRQSLRMGMYREGDFIVHFAGMENKMAFVEKFKQKAV